MNSQNNKLPLKVVDPDHNPSGGSLKFPILSGGRNAGKVSNNECGEKKSGMGTDHSTNPPPAQKLPDPWLFDSESLIREIDRIREVALQVPTNGDSNATHFGLQLVINAAWNLRENVRWICHLHRDAQGRFRSKGAGRKHQTVYVRSNQLLISCLQPSRLDKEKAICGIYYLWDGAGVIYIGKSTDVAHRISTHRTEFDFSGYFVDECPTEQLFEREAKAISEYRPRYNVAMQP